MRKLVFILIAFIAVVTFIRAYDQDSRPEAAGSGGVSGPVPVEAAR